MKRALKIVGKVLLGLLILLLVFVFVFLAGTSLFLNGKTLKFAMTHFGKDYRPKWKELELKVGGSFLTKRVVFHAADLCFDETHGAMTGCFPALDLDATLHLGLSPFLAIPKLDTLIVHSETLKIDETAAPQTQAKKKKKSSRYTQLPQFLPSPVRTMTIGTLDVKIPKAVVISSSGTTTAKLTADFSAEASKPLTAEAFVVMKGTAPNMTQHYAADLILDSDLFREGKLTHLDAKAKVRGDKDMSADVSAKIEQAAKNELRLLARATARMSGKKLEAKLDGTQTPTLYELKADLAVVDPSGPLRRAELSGCDFKAPVKKGTSKPSQADLRCGIILEPAPFGKAKGAKTKKLTGELTVHADFKPRLSKLQRDYFESQVKLQLGPSKDFHNFVAKLEAKVAGRTGDIPQSLTTRHELQVSFKIPDFGGLVDFLDSTDYAIPAPLNALKGPITFEAKTSGKTSGRDHAVGYRLVTDLSSAKQAIRTETSGKLMIQHLFEPDQTASDTTEVDLKKVVIELPYLKIGAPPSPVVDKRIKTGNPKRDAAVEAQRQDLSKSTAPSAVDYNVHVFSSIPIVIASNLLKEPMPISLDVRAKPEGMAGTINIEPFNMEVFHQIGHVDHITFKPSPQSSSMPLDGKVVYKKEDATINILLLGSTDKPTIAFESDPPMTQSEIVGLLLFGKSPAELDSDQAASAGNASAAMTNGALGLASLYLFASTPIDSVGYDAATQTYQIRFKLPGGATLAVGSNLQESKTLTLRKRVAKHVELETQMSRSQTQQGNALTTFLQWFKRY